MRLHKRTVLGRIQLVRSVTAVYVVLKDSVENEDGNMLNDLKALTTREEHNANHEEGITPNVDLHELSAELQPAVRKMLYEERDAFARNEDDRRWLHSRPDDGYQPDVYTTSAKELHSDSTPPVS